VTSKLPKGALRLGSTVTAVSSEHINGQSKVAIRTADGRTEEYDHVILACHSGTAIQLLSNSGQITPDEKAILGGFQWTQNRVVLHSDISVSTALPTLLLKLTFNAGPTETSSRVVRLELHDRIATWGEGREGL
jgi:predicted NAD/FAD-binding protein